MLVSANGMAVTAYVERVSIPTRDLSRMLYRSPPFAHRLHAGTTECFPYPVWDETAGARRGPVVDQAYESVVLSNSLLRVVLLPELGGRLWQATDLQAARDLFASGTALHPQGLWKTGNGFMRSARGLRFDFPEWGHDPSGEQPWSAELLHGEETAGVRMAYTNLRSRLVITETVRLRHDSSAIEITTTLHNPTAEARRFKYWTIDYVPIDASSRIVTPTAYAVDHAGRQTWRWPVHDGKNLARVAAWPGDASFFPINPTQGFSAVISTNAGTGLIRIFPHRVVPGIKFYADWNTTYVNTYGGAARTMEEWRWLQAGETLEWTEYRYAIDGLPDVTAAGPQAALHARIDPSHGIWTLDMLTTSPRKGVRASCRTPGGAPAAVSPPFDLEPGRVHALTLQQATPFDPDATMDLALVSEATQAPLVEWHGRAGDLAHNPDPVETTTTTNDLPANGSFESLHPNARPVGWQMRMWEGTGRLETLTGGAFDGQYSVLAANDRGRCKIGYISDPVALHADRPYTVTIAYHAPELEQNEWGEAAAVLVTDPSGWHAFAKTTLPATTGTWVRVETPFRPTGSTETIRIFLQLYGQGEIRFDGVRVAPGKDNVSASRPRFTDTGRVCEAGAPTAGKPDAACLQRIGPERDIALRRPGLPFEHAWGLTVDAENRPCFLAQGAKWRGRLVTGVMRKSNGETATLFSPTGQGHCFHPSDIDVDALGRFRVVDSGNNRIVLFDAGGEYMKQIGEAGDGPGQFDGPGELALAGDGHMLVTDIGNARVAEFDAADRFVGFPVGPQHLASPFGIAVDRLNRLVVADTGDARIKVFGRDGTPLLTLGGYGEAPGLFIRPALVATDADNRIWVADTALSRVSVFDGQGRLERILGPAPNTPVPFGWITGMTIDRQNRLLVLDALAEKPITCYAPDGRFTESLPVSGLGGETALYIGYSDIVTADGRGNIYASNTNRRDLDMLCRYGADGFLWQTGSHGAGPAQFNWIGKAAVDRDGRVWALDRGNARIHAFDSEGRYLQTLQRESMDQPWFAQAVALDTGPDGRLYVSDTVEGAVFVLAPGSGRVERTLTAGPDFHPGSLVVTPDGRTWAHDTPNHRLAIFSPDGTLHRFVPTGVAEDLPAAVHYLDHDPGGHVLLLDRHNGRLLRYDAEGTPLPDVPLPLEARERLFACMDFYVDAAQRLTLVSKDRDGTAVRLTTFDYAN
jgi:DNA-binding beta-propeller fold protein YncE